MTLEATQKIENRPTLPPVPVELSPSADEMLEAMRHGHPAPHSVIVVEHETPLSAVGHAEAVTVKTVSIPVVTSLGQEEVEEDPYDTEVRSAGIRRLHSSEHVAESAAWREGKLVHPADPVLPETRVPLGEKLISPLMLGATAAFALFVGFVGGLLFAVVR